MKKFNTSINGYAKTEVNNFVDEVAKEYESMLNNLKAKDQEIAALKEQLERFKVMENTLNRAILVAEEASHNIKKVAREEYKGIVEDAKRNASRIVNDALIKAERVEQEAQNLKRRVIIFKRRFKQAVEEQLEVIESIEENY